MISKTVERPFLAGFLVLLTVIVLFSVDSPAEAGSRYQQKNVNIAAPDVVLVNQNNERVRLKSLLASDRPVIVDFIYCTCTTICPVLSSGFANLQQKLGSDSAKVHLVSISIDPENDTPKLMKEYLKRFQARPGWDFLTGTRKDIDMVMKAFDAYFPNKMSHTLLTFIRSPYDGKWIRINGMMSAADLLAESRKAGLKY